MIYHAETIVPARVAGQPYPVEQLIPVSDVPDGMRARIVELDCSSSVQMGYVFRDSDGVRESGIRWGDIRLIPYTETMSAGFWIGDMGLGVDVENRTAGPLTISAGYELIRA